MIKMASLIFFVLLAGTLLSKDFFVAITPEQAGTPLLIKALTLLTGKECEHDGQLDTDGKPYHEHIFLCEKHRTFSHTHLPADEKYIHALQTRKYKVVFLMRDPRDLLISMFYNIKDNQGTFNTLSMGTEFAAMLFDDQIEEMISGKLLGTSIPKVVVGWKLPWMYISQPEVFTVRYENLVGPLGGGSRDTQIKELTAMAKFLNLKVSKRLIAAIADHLYTEADKTFTGEVGVWRKHFTDPQKKLFKETFGDELIFLGYEKDNFW